MFAGLVGSRLMQYKFGNACGIGTEQPIVAELISNTFAAQEAYPTNTENKLPAKQTLYTLIYVSRAQVPFSDDELKRLVDKAKTRNRSLGISGYLCSFGQTFIQYLEGDESRVAILMDSIKKDKRHEVLNYIELDKIENRLFPDWGMRLITNEQLIETQLEQVLREMLTGLHQKALEDQGLKRILKSMIDRIATRRTEWDVD